MPAPDRESAKDRLLDLFVFAPAGLALTIAEELPSLVEKGRNRIEGRSATARVVGQFAVQMGFREVSKRLRHVLEPEPEPAKPERGSRRAAPPRNIGTAREQPQPGHLSDSASAPTPPVDVHADTSSSSNGQAARGDLAIPAYDTLSASQVVKLLAGLSTDELLEVQAHERSNRHRATILNRVEQLLTGEPSLEGP